MKKITPFLFILFSFFSCSDTKKTVVDDEIMCQIVYDLMKERKELNYKGVPGDSVPLYFYSSVKPQVLKRYGVSNADFDTTYVRLSSRPVKFEAFWKSVKVVADSAYKKMK